MKIARSIDIVKREKSALLVHRKCSVNGRKTNSNVVQVKYTNQKRDDLRVVAGSIHAFDRKKIFFFWIKSSARRAFGGCLGSKRR